MSKIPSVNQPKSRRKLKSYTLDDFWDNQEQELTNEPEPEPEPIKKQPLSKEEKFDRAMARYHNSAMTIACKKAHSYLWGILQAERQKVWRQAMRYTHLSRSDRVRLTWMCVSEGGLLPFARDELMPPARLHSVFGYQPYIAIRLGEDEAQRMVRDWFEEGMSEAKCPDIPDIPDSNEGEFKIPIFGSRNRKKEEERLRRKQQVTINVDLDQPDTKDDEIMKLSLADD
jgi:hypothetical protein